MTSRQIIKKICFSAMLIVLDILLTAIPRYFEIGPLFSFNRITLGPATVIFTSIVLGPLYGAVVGGASDFLSWVILPNSGASINIFITILYTLLGIAPYFLFKLFNRPFFKKNSLIYVILSAIFALLVVLLFASDLFDKSFVEWGWDLLTAKIIVSVICFILLVCDFLILYFLKKKYQDDEFLAIVLTCIVCEICLMVLLKPLCFILNWSIIGVDWEASIGVSYSLLVILALMFSSAMIPLNSFAVSSIKKVTYKYFNKE